MHIVGKDSNALVWPPPSPDDEEELDERESYHNQRLMRIGLLIKRTYIASH